MLIWNSTHIRGLPPNTLGQHKSSAYLLVNALGIVRIAQFGRDSESVGVVSMNYSRT